MRQATFLLTAGTLAVCTSTALGQHWVKFSNETSSRLVAASNVGANNVDEKDYAHGDLDMDGDIDLVAVYKQPFTTPGKRRNVLFMNEGLADGQAINGVLVDRTAALVPQFLDLTNDRDVAIVDVNGDGWPDVVTSTTLSGNPAGTNGDKHVSHPRIYINQGQSNGNPPPLTSTWLGLNFDDDARVPLEPTEPRFCSVSFGDIDNDGDQDLYFGDYQQGGNRTMDLNDRLWINNGNGYFTDESHLGNDTNSRMTTEMLESSFGMATQIADMNNDGFLDIIKDDALNAPQAVSISYNNPANPGYYNRYDLPHAHSPYHVVVGNLNNDGLLDMVVSDDAADRYRLGTSISGGVEHFSDNTFSFTGGGNDDGFASDNYIFDLNNDGWNDVVICDVDVDIGGGDGCSDGRRMHVYKNLGGTPGGFVNLQEQIIGGDVVGGIAPSMLVGTHDCAIFDINGDGWLDMVIGRCSGTTVWINMPPDGLQFTYPGGLPDESVMPGGEVVFQVQLAGADGGTPDPGTGIMHLSINGGAYNDVAMTSLGGNLYETSLPAGDCANTFRYYFSGDTMAGGTYYDPPSGQSNPYITYVAESISLTFQDNIEGDTSAWSVVNHPTLTSGGWAVAVPIGANSSTTLLQSAPSSDAGPGGDTHAWVTQNGLPGGSASTADIDGGPTQLITPQFSLAGTDGIVSYDRWFFTEGGTLDALQVEISNDDGANWSLVEHVTVSGSTWVHHTFQASEVITTSAQMRVRFTANDNPNDSVTEAGVDNFEVDEFVCNPPPSCLGDIVDSGTFQPPSDGKVDGADLAYLLGAWGRNPGSVADIVDSGTFQPPPDGQVDGADLAYLLGAWGLCN